jgi:hypothetical protein
MTPENILDGYVFEADFARAHNIGRRTVKRYRNEPDGVPFVMFGGRVYIPIEKARAWLERRTRSLNPRRAA